MVYGGFSAFYVVGMGLRPGRREAAAVGSVSGNGTACLPASKQRHFYLSGNHACAHTFANFCRRQDGFGRRRVRQGQREGPGEAKVREPEKTVHVPERSVGDFVLSALAGSDFEGASGRAAGYHWKPDHANSASALRLCQGRGAYPGGSGDAGSGGAPCADWRLL